MRARLTPELTLRVGGALTFAGHGVFAWLQRPGWVKYLETVGFAHATSLKLLPVIGALDLAVAVALLVRPPRLVLWWALLWTVATAVIRPLAGEPIWEMLERGANCAFPLALLLLSRPSPPA